MKDIYHGAGGILFKKESDKNYSFYLAFSPKYGFVLPKGTRENNDDDLTTACREVREEAGFEVATPAFDLGIQEYQFYNSELQINYIKKVHYYAFDVTDSSQKKLQLDGREAIEIGQWCDYKESLEKLSNEQEKNVIMVLQAWVMRNDNQH